jgi:CHAD domain-containing protein
MDRPDLVVAPVKSRRVPGVRLDGSREEVVRLLLSRTWDVAIVNARAFADKGDADVELLHQFRVALRRCRVFERELGAPLGQELRQTLRSPMRELFRASDALRNLHALKTSDDPILIEIREAVPGDAIEAMHRAARDGLEEASRADSFVVLGETMRALSFARTRERPRDFGRFLSRRIERRLARTRELARDVHPSSPDEAFHRLRRSAKALRYLNDVVLLRGEERAKRMRRETTALQDALGALQDFVVADSLARRLGVEIEGAPSARHERRRGALEAARRFVRKT